jgi:hypothetical protein
VLSVPLDAHRALEQLGGLVGESPGILGRHEIAAIALLLLGLGDLHAVS